VRFRRYIFEFGHAHKTENLGQSGNKSEHFSEFSIFLNTTKRIFVRQEWTLFLKHRSSPGAHPNIFSIKKWIWQVYCYVHTRDNFTFSSFFFKSQIFLMEYLSDSTSHMKTIQLSLSLIGLWYNDQRKGIFGEIFHNDNVY
jgi:hypothetical protein